MRPVNTYINKYYVCCISRNINVSKTEVSLREICNLLDRISRESRRMHRAKVQHRTLLRIMTTRNTPVIATCTGTYLYCGPGIARSRARSVPLFNPINNSRYLTPNPIGNGQQRIRVRFRVHTVRNILDAASHSGVA